jgi:hypothetical protein
MTRRTILILPVIIALLITGCGTKSPSEPSSPPPGETPPAQGETLEEGVLTPSQINSSMADSYVKVRGKITLVNRDSGGLALWLSDDKGKVGARIENQAWEKMTAAEQAQYEKGKQ